MVERIKMQSNRLLTKDASGNVTFDSNNLYLKTVSSGDFSAGGLRQVSMFHGVTQGSSQISNIQSHPIAGAAMVKNGFNVIPNADGAGGTRTGRVAWQKPNSTDTHKYYSTATSAVENTPASYAESASLRTYFVPQGVQTLSNGPSPWLSANSTLFFGAQEPQILTYPSSGGYLLKKWNAHIYTARAIESYTTTSGKSLLPLQDIYKGNSVTNAANKVGKGSWTLRHRYFGTTNDILVSPTFVEDGFYAYFVPETSGSNAVDWSSGGQFVTEPPNFTDYAWRRDDLDGSYTILTDLVGFQRIIWHGPETLSAAAPPVNLNLVVTP